MTTLTIPAKALSEAVARFVSMSDRASAAFSRTTGLLMNIDPEQTQHFVHCRVANGTIRYSEYVPCAVEGERTAWRIPVHELARITAGMNSNEPITLSDGQPQLHIQGAGIKAKIPLIADTDFLTWEIVDPKTMDSAPELFANIHAVEWAAENRNDSTANITAVHFARNLIAATDRYSMAFAKADYPETFTGGMVNAVALRSLPRLGYAPLVKFTEHALVLQISPHAQASVSLTAAKPLNFPSLMVKHVFPDGKATFDAKEFTTTLKRASNLTGPDRQLDMTFSEGAITFTAGDPAATIAQFSVEAEVEGISEMHTVRVNADRIGGAMREAKEQAVIGFDPNIAMRAVHVHTSRSQSIIMPIKTGQ